MRKRAFAVLIVITMFLCYNSNVVLAASGNDISVVVDGQKVVFDVAPRLIGGRTMVPLRAIFERLGAIVEWDEMTQTVTAYNEIAYVKSTIGSNVMYVNNVQKTIDIAPMKIDSRTLVPVRFVAEAFACDVQWNPETMTVTITSAPIDYSKVEQGNTSVKTETEQDSGKTIFTTPSVSCYPGTDVPTYTSIVGVSLKNTYASNGTITYIYDYEQEDFLDYVATLMRYGWTVYKQETSMEGTRLTCYMIKGNKIVGVAFAASYNETWIGIVD